MPRPDQNRIGWDQETLEIEALNCKEDPAHFNQLLDHIIEKLTIKVISKKDLNRITTREDLAFFVKEALDKYDSKRHGKLAWYVYQRLRFLVGKWRRHKKIKGSTQNGG